MSAKKTILNEQEIKRFAKLSGVKITPELLNERQPTVEDAIVRGGGAPVPDRGTVGAAVAAANDPTYGDIMKQGQKTVEAASTKATKKGKVVTDIDAWNKAEQERQAGGTYEPEDRQKNLDQSIPAALANTKDEFPAYEYRPRIKADTSRRGGRKGGRRSRGLNKLQNAGFKNYGDFYKALDAKGMTGLLGSAGADKKFGKGHQKALDSYLQSYVPTNYEAGTEAAPWQRAAIERKTGHAVPTGQHARTSDYTQSVVGPAGAKKGGYHGGYDDTYSDEDMRLMGATPASTTTPAPAAPSRPGYTASGDRDYDKGSWQGGRWKANPIQENKGFSSQEEELIQTLTERILIKYFKK